MLKLISLTFLSAVVNLSSALDSENKKSNVGCYFNIERPPEIVKINGPKRMRLSGIQTEEDCHFVRDSAGRLSATATGAALGFLRFQDLIHALLHDLSVDRVKSTVLSITLSYKREDGSEVIKENLPLTDEMIRFISDVSRT